MTGDNVTVVIPVRNGARFIDKALASVVTQTRPATEVIVVDDGSNDDSYQRAMRWTDLLPLKVQRTEPVGTWHARKVAIDAASCDLIAQLDADDAFAPHHLATMLQAYHRHGGLIASRQLLLPEPEGMGVPIPIPYRLPDDAAEQLIHMLVVCRIGVGALFERDTYHAVGGYRPGTFYFEDWDLWLRFNAAGHRISASELASYLYRVHPDNKTTQSQPRFAEQAVLRKFLDDNDDRERRRVAKLAILQRAGYRYLSTLQRVGDEVYTDPDLGEITVSGDPTAVRTLVVTSSEGEVGMRADVIDDDSWLRVTESNLPVYWPEFGTAWWRKYLPSSA